MKSMTGYAYKESSSDKTVVSAEIKSYNSRFLDLSVHLPPWLSSFEPRIREYLSSRFIRGKVEASIRVKEENAPVSVSINESAVIAYEKAIVALAKTLGREEKPGLQFLLDLDGVVEIETERDAGRYWSLIEPVLIAASDQADVERSREGGHTRADILSNVGVLEESVALVSSRAPEIETSVKENLRSRFAELLGDKIDENRVLAETAVLLVKYTISEELSRLDSHLKEFRLETERNPSPGKKLDFLSQEINREINTIGSKTPLLDVSREVVKMKNALEDIREQLRNVE